MVLLGGGVVVVVVVGGVGCDGLEGLEEGSGLVGEGCGLFECYFYGGLKV